MDWKDPLNDDHPACVRKRDWIPCDCPDDDKGQIRCFFCQHGLTHGIVHRPKSSGRPPLSRPKKKCFHNRIKMKCKNRCVHCIEELKEKHPTWSSEQVRKAARNPALGCKCGAHVCKEHWSDHGN